MNLQGTFHDYDGYEPGLVDLVVQRRIETGEEFMNWADVKIGDHIIMESGTTIVSGPVIDLPPNGEVAIIGVLGPVETANWRLGHIITQREIEGLTEPQEVDA